MVKAFKKAGLEKQIPHFKRTAYWVRKLKPDADGALLIAALAHDIERATRTKEELERLMALLNSPLYIKPHQQEGARIIGEFLEKCNVNQKLIKRVKMLIVKHEEGGNDDQNLLKDADTISFFENNVEHFLERVPKSGKEKIKDKFDWMFNRITSEKAQEIAKPWYKKAIKKLEKSL